MSETIQMHAQATVSQRVNSAADVPTHPYAQPLQPLPLAVRLPSVTLSAQPPVPGFLRHEPKVLTLEGPGCRIVEIVGSEMLKSICA